MIRENTKTAPEYMLMMLTDVLGGITLKLDNNYIYISIENVFTYIQIKTFLRESAKEINTLVTYEARTWNPEVKIDKFLLLYTLNRRQREHVPRLVRL